jgi:hypothetical protein
MPGAPHRTQCIRTERAQYFIWGGIGLVLLLVSANNVGEHPSHWYSLILLILAWSIVFLWLAAYKISIDEDVLSYSALLKGTVSISRDDIVSAEVLSGRLEHAIIINPKSGDRIIINTKPFRRSDVQIVLQFLADKIVVNKADLV